MDDDKLNKRDKRDLIIIGIIVVVALAFAIGGALNLGRYY